MVRLLATIGAISTLVGVGGCGRGGGAEAGSTSDSLTAQSTASPPPQSGVLAAQTESFQRFWTAFRQAVGTGDGGTIASVTRFPFETRGPSDDDAIRKHDRAAFPALLDSLLAQESGMGNGETTRQLIERTTTVTERNAAPGSSEARVGDFSFLKTAGRWWFTRAYTDE